MSEGGHTQAFKTPCSPGDSPSGNPRGGGGFQRKSPGGYQGGNSGGGQSPGISFGRGGDRGQGYYTNDHNMYFNKSPGNQEEGIRTTPNTGRCDRRDRSNSGEKRRSDSNSREHDKDRGRNNSQQRNRKDGRRHEGYQDRSNMDERYGNQQWNGSPQNYSGYGYDDWNYNSPPGNQNYQRQQRGGQHGRRSNPNSPHKGGQGGSNRGKDVSWDNQTHNRHRGGWEDDSDVFLSKTLSSILRHNAERFGFQLMKGGFLYVDEILQYVQKLRGYTEEDVKRIVDSNDKKRFALEREGERLKIRANQGHSIEIEDLELTPIVSADEVPMVIHGTYYTSWELIKKTGLRRMNRNHIHFAAGEPGENGVISGMRKTCEVMIHIDMEKALKDGLKFFRSANNVILCSGDEKGFIYPCYFSGVVDRRNWYRLEFDNTINASTEENKPAESKKRKKKHNKEKNNQEEVTEDVGEKMEEPTRQESEEGASTDDTSLPAAKKQHVSETVTPEKSCTEKPEPDTPEKSCAEKPETDTPEKSCAEKPETEKVETNRNENLDFEEDKVKSSDWQQPTLVNDAAESKILMEGLCSTPPSHIAVCCVGENLDNKDSRIRMIVLTAYPNSYIFHLHDENKDLVKEGHLDQLLVNKKVSKVFFDIGAVSTSLIREFDVLMDGAPIWDILMMFNKMSLPKMDLEQLNFEKADFKKWKKENEEYGKNLSKIEDFNAENAGVLVERGKLMWDLYRLCNQKLDEGLIKKLRKEIFQEAIPSHESVDKALAEKIKSLKLERKGKKPADKTDGAAQQPNQQQQQQQQQQQKQQNKQQGKGKGKGKKK